MFYRVEFFLSSNVYFKAYTTNNLINSLIGRWKNFYVFPCLFDLMLPGKLEDGRKLSLTIKYLKIRDG